VLGSVEGITLGLNEQSAAARDIAQRVEQIAGRLGINAASAARITRAAASWKTWPARWKPFPPASASPERHCPQEQVLHRALRMEHLFNFDTLRHSFAAPQHAGIRHKH
jgi:hypothetical protein